MNQIGCSPLSRNKGAAGGYLRSSYYILIALSSLVATTWLFCLLAGTFLYMGSDIAQTYYNTIENSTVRPTGLIVALPCP